MNRRIKLEGCPQQILRSRILRRINYRSLAKGIRNLKDREDHELMQKEI